MGTRGRDVAPSGTRGEHAVMRRDHGGFSLVSATFIVVVVALLAGFLVNIGNAQRATTSFALQGLRASAAVQSGMEWAIARVLRDGACVASGRPFGLEGLASRTSRSASTVA